MWTRAIKVFILQSLRELFSVLPLLIYTSICPVTPLIQQSFKSLINKYWWKRCQAPFYRLRRQNKFMKQAKSYLVVCQPNQHICSALWWSRRRYVIFPQLLEWPIPMLPTGAWRLRLSNLWDHMANNPNFIKTTATFTVWELSKSIYQMRNHSFMTAAL